MTAPQTQTSDSSPAVHAKTWRIVAASLVVLGACAASAAWLSNGAPLSLVIAAWVVGTAIFLWASAAIPEYLTALILFFLAVLTQTAPPSVVFSGFHSTAVWLVFGGMVLGLAVQQSGFADRAVTFALRANRTSYRSLIWSLAVVGLGLSFVVPSAMGRVMIMIPIVVALADRLGLDAGNPGRTGMVLAAGLSTTLPAFGILPSNVPNMAMMGAAASIYGVDFRFGDYLLLNFTVLGTLAFVAIPVVICRLYPQTLPERPAKPEANAWSEAERRLAIILGFTIAFWATDFLHHVSPAWVALGAAIVCVAPRVGVIEPAAVAKLNFGPWIFVAGVIGLGAIASHSGLASLAGQMMVDMVDLGSLARWQQYAGIVAIGTLTGIITSLPAAPAVMTPLADALSQTTGWPLESVLMAQVPTWVVFAFPYQAPPVVVTLALGGIRVGQAMPVMLTLFGFGVLVSLPLHFGWMQFLGFVP